MTGTKLTVQRIIPACLLGGSAEAGLFEMKRALSLEPNSFYARQQMFRMIRPRWFGVSTLSAVEFAQRAAAGAPKGSSLHLLLFQAVTDLEDYLAHFEEDHEAAERVWSDMRDSLRAAWETFHQPGRQFRKSEFVAINAAAACFYFARDDDYLTLAMRVVGTRFESDGWSHHYPTAMKSFRHARALSGLGHI